MAKPFCRSKISVVAIALALILSYTVSAAGARPTVVGYVPNWIDLAAFSRNIDYSKLTHINIAFENPRNDGGDLSFHEADAVLVSRARQNHVAVLVSIGGGSASENRRMRERYGTLLGEGKRAEFVARLAAYVSRHDFDGLDLDLEGPLIDGNYGAFVTDLARALRPQGKLLTAALSKGYGGDKVPQAALSDLDFVNVMAYDATGPWRPDRPGQHSSMEYARENVAYWVGRGLPKSKAVLGLPFYGHGFGEAFRKGGYPYAEIVATYPGAEHADEAGKTIWYNGIETVEAKTRYAVEQGLGGVMIWSVDQDAGGDKSLLLAIDRAVAARP